MNNIRQAGKDTYTKLVRKPETDEWVVKVYVNGKYDEDKTYYTDDKQDAIATQKHMNRELGITASVNIKVARELVRLARIICAEAPISIDEFGLFSGDIVKGIPALIVKGGNSALSSAKSQPNVFTFRRSYFYRGGLDSKKYADAVVQRLTERGFNATVLDKGDHWAAFKGGAKSYSAQDSFFWAVVKVERQAQA